MTEKLTQEQMDELQAKADNEQGGGELKPSPQGYRDFIAAYRQVLLMELKHGGIVDTRFILDKDNSLVSQYIKRGDDGSLILLPANKQNLCKKGSTFRESLINFWPVLDSVDEKVVKAFIGLGLEKAFGYHVLPAAEQLVLGQELAKEIIKLPFQRFRNWYLEEDKTFDDLVDSLKDIPDDVVVDDKYRQLCYGYLKPQGFLEGKDYVEDYNFVLDQIFHGCDEGSKEAFLEFLARLVFEDRVGSVAPVLHLVGKESSGKSILVQLIQGILGGMDAQAVDLGGRFFTPNRPLIYAGEVKAGNEGSFNKKNFSDHIKRLSKETGMIFCEEKNVKGMGFVPHFYTIVTSNEQVLVETPESKLDNVVGIYLNEGKTGDCFMRDGEDVLNRLKPKRSGGRLPAGFIPVAFYREVLFPIYQRLLGRYKEGNHRFTEFKCEAYESRLESHHSQQLGEIVDNIMSYLAYAEYVQSKQREHKIENKDLPEICLASDLEFFGVNVHHISKSNVVELNKSSSSTTGLGGYALNYMRKEGMEVLPTVILNVLIGIPAEDGKGSRDSRITNARHALERVFGFSNPLDSNKKGSRHNRVDADLSFLYKYGGPSRGYYTFVRITNQAFGFLRRSRERYLSEEVKKELDDRINQFLVLRSERDFSFAKK